MDHVQIVDKAQGALIGSAIGDAIGIYTEFMTPEQCIQAYPSATFSLVEPATEAHQDSHRCRFESRAWTDDTDHTLLMILSFLRNGSLSPDDFAGRLRTWCSQGLRCLDRLPMGLGRTVGRVVYDENFLAHPSETAFIYWDKSGRDIAPNGSLMRTTPIGVICMKKSEEETFKEAIKMGAVTHADPRCALSVAIVSGLVRALCRDEIRDEADINALLERGWTYMAQSHPNLSLDRAEFHKHVLADSLDSLVLCDPGMGYVYKCLGSALWCLRQVLAQQETFKSAMTKLVMCGGDADTNGAVAGALMGASYGYTLLPREWKEGLKYQEWYKGKISSLCVVASLTEGHYDAKEDRDTEPDGGKGFLTEEQMKKREMEIMEKILLADKSRREGAEKRTTIKKKGQWKFW